MRADISQPYRVRPISSCCSNMFHFLPFLSSANVRLNKYARCEVASGAALHVSAIQVSAITGDIGLGLRNWAN
jgi:hypothetical protein